MSAEASGGERASEDAMEYEWAPDPEWRVGGEGKTCRMLRCPNAAVAALLRRNRRGHLWWHYCADHLYGRRIIDGVACYPRAPIAGENGGSPNSHADRSVVLDGMLLALQDARDMLHDLMWSRMDRTEAEITEALASIDGALAAARRFEARANPEEERWND